MRWILIVALGLLVGCGSQNGTGTGDGEGAVPFPDAQKIIDGVAANHPNLTRLTLHAVPTGKAVCTQLASTMAGRRGKPSDPEDLKALETGEEVILDEEGALDVTVPILMKDGKPTAVAGVTLAVKEGADRDALVSEARTIAQEVEKGVEAAGKPVW